MNGVPAVQVFTVCDPSMDANYVASYINSVTENIGNKPVFSMFRMIWSSPKKMLEAYNKLKNENPDKKFEIVDPYTFFALYKQVNS